MTGGPAPAEFAERPRACDAGLASAVGEDGLGFPGPAEADRGAVHAG